MLSGCKDLSLVNDKLSALLKQPHSFWDSGLFRENSFSTHWPISFCITLLLGEGTWDKLC